MNKFILILLISFIITLTFADNTASPMMHQEMDELDHLPGVELIVDKQIRAEVLGFLFVYGNLDFKKIYYYLSNDYLQKHYPNIHNAEEFQTDMENIQRNTKPS